MSASKNGTGIINKIVLRATFYEKHRQVMVPQTAKEKNIILERADGL